MAAENQNTSPLELTSDFPSKRQTPQHTAGRKTLTPKKPSSKLKEARPDAGTSGEPSYEAWVEENQEVLANLDDFFPEAPIAGPELGDEGSSGITSGIEADEAQINEIFKALEHTSWEEKIPEQDDAQKQEIDKLRCEIEECRRQNDDLLRQNASLTAKSKEIQADSAKSIQEMRQELDLSSARRNGLTIRNSQLLAEIDDAKKKMAEMEAETLRQRQDYEREKHRVLDLRQDLDYAVNVAMEELKARIRKLGAQLRRKAAEREESEDIPPPPCEDHEIWTGRARDARFFKEMKREIRSRCMEIDNEIEETKARTSNREREFARKTGWKCPVPT